nr:MAG TPA: hypothetical protein [Caudoviricetes sp.]DAU10565.1 MAG TPA: hypothetical protein [Caudoviricetes sp.]DAX56166.1 MAG TPA: hypothetical protein [Caudoviricetes sp.]
MIVTIVNDNYKVILLYCQQYVKRTDVSFNNFL